MFLSGYLLRFLLGIAWWGADRCSASVSVLPCPRGSGRPGHLPGICDTCTYEAGDTCESNCSSPQDPNFICTAHNETGWRHFHNRTGQFVVINDSGHELAAINLYHHNVTDHNTMDTFRSPALNITVNIRAKIRGSIPKALLMKVTAVNGSDSVRDNRYSGIPLYRLYSFPHYSPTTRDRNSPQHVSLRCINNLDTCGEKVYSLEVVSFLPEMRTQKVIYTITSPNNRTQSWPPVIATALHPRYNSVTVVFETNTGQHVTNVALVKVNQTSDGPSQNEISNRVVFTSVPEGIYEAVITVGGKTCHSYHFCVPKYPPTEGGDPCINLSTTADLSPTADLSTTADISTTTDIGDESSEVSDHDTPAYILPVSILMVLLVFGVCFIVVSAWCIFKRTRVIQFIKRNRQIPKDSTTTRILLLYRKRDERTATRFIDLVGVHFPWVTFVVEHRVKTPSANRGTWMEQEVMSCAHVLLLWCPALSGDRAETIDAFVESVVNGFIPTTTNICMVFSSGNVDRDALPAGLDRTRQYDLITDLEMLCQQCFSLHKEGTTSIKHLLTSPTYKALLEIYAKVSVEISEAEHVPLLTVDRVCPVHDFGGFKDMDYCDVYPCKDANEVVIDKSDRAPSYCPFHEQWVYAEDYNTMDVSRQEPPVHVYSDLQMNKCHIQTYDGGHQTYYHDLQIDNSDLETYDDGDLQLYVGDLQNTLPPSTLSSIETKMLSLNLSSD